MEVVALNVCAVSYNDDESQIIFADVNKDNSVDISDALMVARFDAGLITAF